MTALNKLAHICNAVVQPEKKIMQNRKTVSAQLLRMETEQVVENSPSSRVEAEKEVDTAIFSRVIAIDNTGQPENDAPHVIPADTGGNTPRVRVPRRTRATALYVIQDETGMCTEIHHKVGHQKQQVQHIVLDVDNYETIRRYIRKYNTRSAPKYAFAAEVIQQQQFTKNIVETQEYINLVLHPDTGKTCTYKKLAAGEVPG